MATTGKERSKKKYSKKPKDKKCYVLMVSRSFPSTHVQAGSPTHFVEKICKALGKEPPVPYGGWDAWEVKALLNAAPKLHTIRLNYDLWKKRFDEVNAGTAYLSLRYWTDLPYKSPQEEFLRLENTDGIGIQKLGFTPLGLFIDEYDSDTSIKDIAQNDGLGWEDFKSWFGEIKQGSEYVIIHFTGKRYTNSFTEMQYSKLNYTFRDE